MEKEVCVYDYQINNLAFELTLLALNSFDFGGKCSVEDARAFRESAYYLIKSQLGLDSE